MYNVPQLSVFFFKCGGLKYSFNDAVFNDVHDLATKTPARSQQLGISSVLCFSGDVARASRSVAGERGTAVGSLSCGAITRTTQPMKFLIGYASFVLIG